jgi:CopG antitoxin of type II toxin-antitoxin system
MKKKLPKLASDAEAEAFVVRVDLTEFDLSEMRELRFKIGPHPSPPGKGDNSEEIKQAASLPPTPTPQAASDLPTKGKA